MRLPFILAVLLIATPGLALANAGGTKPPGVIKGYARVVDGDTIWIGDTKIRLHGIDAQYAASPSATQGRMTSMPRW